MGVVQQHLSVRRYRVILIQKLIRYRRIILQMRCIQPVTIFFQEVIRVLPAHQKGVAGIPGKSQKVIRVTVKQEIKLFVLIFLRRTDQIFKGYSYSRGHRIVFYLVKGFHNLTVVNILFLRLLLEHPVGKLHMKNHYLSADMGTQVNAVFQQIHSRQPAIFIFRRIILADIRQPMTVAENLLAINGNRPFAALRGVDTVGANTIVFQHIPRLIHFTGTVEVFPLPVLHPLGMRKACVREIFNLPLNIDPTM